MTKILVFGAGGYLGRHLLPALGKVGRFQVTACSSQAKPLTIADESLEPVHYVCLPVEDFPIAEAGDYDLVLNLACAGVAHKDEHAMDMLTANLAIAHRICQLAEQTRGRLLLHFGSDTEQSQLAEFLNIPRRVPRSEIVDSAELSLYPLSKVIQSSIIRYHSLRFGLFSHIVMTPNLYGGDDPPGSLLGLMRVALHSGTPFEIRNPSAVKRFIHVRSFSSYVIALLDDLLTRIDPMPRRHCFEVSSVDFVPPTTVADFARRQWERMGGDRDSLVLGHTQVPDQVPDDYAQP